MRRTILITVLLLALLTPVAAEVFPFGEISVQNPVVLVTYTKEVRVQSATLLRTDNSADAYVLNQTPTGATLYTDEYTFTTGKLVGGTWVRTELPAGTYELTLIAVDRNGVATTDRATFEIVGLAITMWTPKFGVAQNIPFTAYLRTTLRNPVTGVQRDIATTCRYSKTGFSTSMLAANTTNGIDHTIPGLDYRGTLYVSCAEANGRSVNKTFAIDYDTSAPTITTSAYPQIVQNPADKSSVIKAITNEPSSCTITRGTETITLGTTNKLNGSSYTTVHESRIFFNDINDQLEHPMTLSITCINLAQRTNTTDVNLTVDLGAYVGIDVLSPANHIATKSFTLAVRPTFSATTCSVGGTIMQKQGANYLSQYSNVQDGTYPFSITCTGENTSTRTYNVTVDTIAPALTLNASPIVCNNTISAQWTATDAGSIIAYHYNVSDAVGTIESATTARQQASVALPRTPFGTLKWTVRAEDLAGNLGGKSADITLLREGNEEECGLPPFIQIISPNKGFASSAPYTLALRTTRESECRYSLQSGLNWSARTALSSTDGITHDAQMSFANQEIFVWCREPNGKNHSKIFHVGVDASQPSVIAQVKPNPIIDPVFKVAEFTVTTDDYTYCTYTGGHIGAPFRSNPIDPSTYAIEHVTTLDFRNITTTTPLDIPYEITCTNLALLNTTVPYVVHVNLGSAFTIARVTPDEFTSAQFVTLSVRPSITATCTWRAANETGARAFTSNVNNTPSVSLGALPEGKYQYIIDCLSSISTASTIIDFTVIRTAPKLLNLSGPAAACVGDRIEYTFDIEGIDQHPKVVYGLTAPGKNFSSDDTTTDEFEISLKNVAAGSYTLRATPHGRNNLTGVAVTKSLDVLALDNAVCSTPKLNGSDPAFCSNLKLDAGEQGIDCGGVCSNACIACLFAGECPTTMTCQSGICVKMPTINPRDIPPTVRNDTPVTPPISVNPAGCTSDFQCDVDEQCRSGACVPLPTPIDPGNELPLQDVDSGTSWLAIVLIVLGLLVMGGSGYYLYEQHVLGSSSHVSPYMPGFSKDFGGARPGTPGQQGPASTQQPARPSVPPMTPQQQAELRAAAARAAAQESRRGQSIDDVRARKDPRMTDRKTALSAFEAGTPRAQQAGAQPQQKPQKKAGKKKNAKKKGGDDDVFKELEKL